MHREADDARKVREKLDADAAMLRQQVETLKDEKTDLEKRVSGLKAIQATVQQEERKLEQIRKEVTEWELSSGHCKSRLCRRPILISQPHGNSSQEASTKRDELVRESLRLESTIERLKSEGEQLTKRLEQMRKEVTEWERRRDAAKADSQKADSDLSAARKLLQEMSAKQGEFVREISRLESMIERLKKDKEERKRNLAAWKANNLRHSLVDSECIQREVMMPNIQLLQWLLWSFALLAGLGVIIALFKLRIAERFLPPWNELKELEATLPVRREELRQVSDAIQSQRQQLATLEGEVGDLHQLREWQQANPDAPARIQQMMVDLERGKSELAAVQQKLAQEEARLIEIAQEVQRATQEKTQLAEQIPLLHDQLAGLQRQKGEWENNLRDLEDQRRQLEFKLVGLKDSVQAHEHELLTLRQQLDTITREKGAAIAERDQVCIARDAAKADLDLTTRRLESARDELKQLEEKTEGLGQQRRRLDDAVDLLTQQRDSLTGDCRAAEAELEKTRAQLDQAEREKRVAMTERDQVCIARDVAKADLDLTMRRLESARDELKQVEEKN